MPVNACLQVSVCVCAFLRVPFSAGFKGKATILVGSPILTHTLAQSGSKLEDRKGYVWPIRLDQASLCELVDPRLGCTQRAPHSGAQNQGFTCFAQASVIMVDPARASGNHLERNKLTTASY